MRADAVSPALVLAPAGADADEVLPQLLLFRLGGELFAMAIGSCEEVLELPDVQRISGMPPDALGVLTLRSRLVGVYSPERVLGVNRAVDDGVALVVRAGETRIAVALDDVDEVIGVDMENLRRPAPREAADGLLLGIARHRGELVAVVDVDVLVAALTNTLAGESR